MAATGLKGKAIKLMLAAALLLLFLPAGCANQEAAGIHLKSGIAYLEARQYTPALKALLDAQKENPDDPQIHYYLGILYHEKNLENEATREFERAIALKPDYSDAYNYVGLIHASAGRHDEAIAAYKKALSNLLYETPSFSWYNMGLSYLKKGSYDEALKSFNEAIRNDPNQFNHARYETEIGKAYLKKGEADKAGLHFSRAVKIAPDFLEARYGLGKSYQLQGRNPLAVREFQTVLTAAPDSELGLKAREEIESLSRPVKGRK